jgi:hypothetical protein
VLFGHVVEACERAMLTCIYVLPCSKRHGMVGRSVLYLGAAVFSCWMFEYTVED